MKNNTLKSKMISYYFTSSLIILVITAIVLITFLNAQIIRIENEKLEKSLENSSEYISLYLGNLKKDITFISNIPEVQEFVSGDSYKNETIIRNILSTIKAKDKYIKTIYLITKDGRNVSTDDFTSMEMGSNMLEKDWYTTAMSEGVKLNPIKEKNYGGMDSWVLTLSKNIKIGDKQGIILLDLQYSALYEYIERLNLETSNEVFIIDEKKEVVFAKDIEQSIRNRNEIFRIQTMNTGYNKKENLIFFNKKIQDTNLEILGVSSARAISLLKIRVLSIILIALLITSISIFFITKTISNRLTNSLDELKYFMQNMDDNLKHIELKKETYTEIGILKEEINNMIDKIKELKKYEIDSLYSQINPHFLYNTLDTLIWMIEFEDNDKAVKLTNNLAKFFRLSLSQGKRLIPLADELEHVKSYLEIQKERYQSKLEYSITCDPEISRFIIPKMIIQPLVENSLYHGIKEIDTVGHISINAYEKEGDIYIEVIDNGVGMHKSSNKLKLGGVGMKNIDSRIKYYFGNDYGLFVDNEYTNGTRITLKLIGKKEV